MIVQAILVASGLVFDLVNTHKQLFTYMYNTCNQFIHRVQLLVRIVQRSMDTSWLLLY